VLVGQMKKSAVVFALLLSSATAWAGVLPEDRADILYHSYDGGGVTIDGPSLLVRKKFAKSFSAFANYYVDSVSSASIDVIATASPYEEERTQISTGIDYLRGKTTMSLGYTKSDENDYLANSLSFGISQDIFGDLTTVTMGYSLGWDEVGMRGDPDFARDVDRQQYRLGLSQILTKNMILGLNFETITDEGFLNNPYRSVRYLDAGGAPGFESEVYPNTRTSNAGSARLQIYLPYRAAIHGTYRFYSDTWEIEGHTMEVGYTHPTKSGFIFDLQYRYYTQSQADFFNDLFPGPQFQNFLARDKELSEFESSSIRFAVSYEFAKNGWGIVDKGTVNLVYDRMQFDYANFRDATAQGFALGDEPLYSFDANVIQLFLSFWF
jgi:hypothetical protein